MTFLNKEFNIERDESEKDFLFSKILDSRKLDQIEIDNLIKAILCLK
jgi:hypothetical protein